MADGIIFDLRELTTHDGPGIRSTVFFKGCPLRCAWCHNPEGLSFKPELMVREHACTHCGNCKKGCAHAECAELGRCIHRCANGLVSKVGERLSAKKLSERMLRISSLLDRKGGGYSISGGEPLSQPEFLFELIKYLKPHHLVVETSGFAHKEIFTRVVELVDLVILDIKHIDDTLHRRGTLQSNEKILGNLALIIASGKKFWVRIPMIPGYNDSNENLRAVAERLSPAAGRVRVELLGYNPLAKAKYPMLGIPYAPFFDETAAAHVDLSFFSKRGIATSWIPK